MIVAVAILFVVRNPGSRAIKHSVSSVTDAQAVNPLDTLSAADIAANASLMLDLPETVAVVNLADTVKAQILSPVVESAMVSKPQILSSDVKTKADIQEYTTVAGDTLAALASKFGVTSDSIRWSNNITGSTVAVGTRLVIPPSGVNGIVYTVKSGDTADSIATKYSADKNRITTFNDAEVTGLKVGERIVVPDGSIAAPSTRSGSSAFINFSYGSGGRCLFQGAPYSSFGYACGFCTWYAAWRGGAPSGWGNATSWAYWAGRTPGWVVSATPRAGAIAQTSGMSYLGHVGIVEAVSEDGSQIRYSDMNGISGYNSVGSSGWVSAGTFPRYIYRQ